MFFILLITLFLLSIVATRFYISIAAKKGLLDIPNHRSSHVTPTVRGGGLVFVGLWLLTLVVLKIFNSITFAVFIFYLVPTALLTILGFVEDNYTLAARWRFLIQIIVAIISLAIIGNIADFNLGFFVLSWSIINLVLAFLAILWSINLFNFMDGTDGFAATEAIFILLLSCLFFYLTGVVMVSYVLLVLVILIGGFLVCNWPKAQVFMGDVGSTPLGLIIVITALYAQKYYHIPIILWMMLYGVFLFDATITLVRRILHGERWYQAHKNHAYQRLHQAGFSHLQILCGLIVINVIITILAFLAFQFSYLITYLVLLEFILLGILYIIIEKYKPMYSKNAHI